MFRIFGIRLAVHVSFLLLLAYVAWEGWAESGWRGGAWSLGLMALLFVCIVLHELGHSLTARRFGIAVPRILLLPIGGMAEFSTIPREPRRELLITLAGPAVNFAIVLALLPFVPMPHFSAAAAVELSPRGTGQFLLWVNLVMGGFNLLPIFPMDGGRILRALLATRWSYLRATFWAASIGKVLAVIGVAVMIFVWPNPLAAILFAFIFIAGDLEYRMLKRREEENAQWEMLLRRLYTNADDGDRGVAVNVLHGPN